MPYPPGSNYSELILRLRDAETSFPNATAAIAELRPHSQTVHLHNISGVEFRRLLDEQRLVELSRPFSIIAHELTHWLDLLGTVWGQEYLIELFDAYEAALNPRENAENGWWKVVRLFDQDRRIMFPRYYKYLLPEEVPHGARNPWSIEYSCGQEFSPDGRIDQSRPIFFTTFGHNATRTRIARQPLSIGTLLETNATWAELITGTQLLAQVPDEAERRVSLALWSREKAELLYNAQLTEYTAPVHLLSVRTNTREAMESYHAGSALALICLNLTESHFAQIRIPEAFMPFGHDRINAFRAAQDRGFAFACISFNAEPLEGFEDVDEWVRSAVARSGLPEIGAIKRSAYERLELIHRQTEVRWPLDRTRDYLLEIGRNIFASRAEMGSTVTPLQLIEGGVPLPPMFEATGNLLHIGRAQLDRSRFDAEQMFYEEWKLREFTSNFLVGCRGNR